MRNWMSVTQATITKSTMATALAYPNFPLTNALF